MIFASAGGRVLSDALAAQAVVAPPQATPAPAPSPQVTPLSPDTPAAPSTHAVPSAPVNTDPAALPVALPAPAPTAGAGQDATQSAQRIPLKFEAFLDVNGRLSLDEILFSSREDAFVPYTSLLSSRENGALWLRTRLDQVAGLTTPLTGNGSAVGVAGASGTAGAPGAPGTSGPSGASGAAGRGLALDLNSRVPGQAPGLVRVWVVSQDSPGGQTLTETAPGIFPLPEPEKSAQASLYIRIADLPGPAFAPELRPLDSLTYLDYGGQEGLRYLIAVALLLGLARGVHQRREWRLWGALYTGAVLVQLFWGIPTTRAGVVSLWDLPGLLAPGVALLILPHVGRYFLRSRERAPFLDFQLILLALPGLALSLLPLMPGYAWTLRFLPLWPLGMLLFLPSLLLAMLRRVPGSGVLFLLYLIPPLGLFPYLPGAFSLVGAFTTQPLVLGGLALLPTAALALSCLGLALINTPRALPPRDARGRAMDGSASDLRLDGPDDGIRSDAALRMDAPGTLRVDTPGPLHVDALGVGRKDGTGGVPMGATGGMSLDAPGVARMDATGVVRMDTTAGLRAGASAGLDLPPAHAAETSAGLGGGFESGGAFSAGYVAPPPPLPAVQRLMESLEGDLRGLVETLFADVSALDQLYLPRDARRLNASLAETGHRLAALIEALPHYEANEAPAEVQTSTFDLHQLIHDAHAAVVERAEARSLALSWFTAPHLSRYYEGDREGLTDVLAQLAASAVEATDSRGMVQIRAQRVPESNDPGHLLFTITDTGRGRPPVSRRAMALVRVWELAARCGGTLNMASSPTGTVVDFTLRLRAVQPKTPLSAVAPLTPRSAVSLRILIASSVPNNRQLLVYYLDELQRELLEARSPDEALSLYTQTPGALVIMDGDMPEEDIITAVAGIRAFEGEEGYPLASIMALANDEEQAVRFRRAGCTHTLLKPVSRTELRHLALRLAPLPERRKQAPPKRQDVSPPPEPAIRRLPNLSLDGVAEAETPAASSLQIVDPPLDLAGFEAAEADRAARSAGGAELGLAPRRGQTQASGLAPRLDPIQEPGFASRAQVQDAGQLALEKAKKRAPQARPLPGKVEPRVFSNVGEPQPISPDRQRSGATDAADPRAGRAGLRAEVDGRNGARAQAPQAGTPSASDGARRAEELFEAVPAGAETGTSALWRPLEPGVRQVDDTGRSLAGRAEVSPLPFLQPSRAAAQPAPSLSVTTLLPDPDAEVWVGDPVPVTPPSSPVAEMPPPSPVAQTPLPSTVAQTPPREADGSATPEQGATTERTPETPPADQATPSEPSESSEQATPMSLETSPSSAAAQAATAPSASTAPSLKAGRGPQAADPARAVETARMVDAAKAADAGSSSGNSKKGGLWNLFSRKTSAPVPPSSVPRPSSYESARISLDPIEWVGEPMPIPKREPAVAAETPAPTGELSVTESTSAVDTSRDEAAHGVEAPRDEYSTGPTLDDVSPSHELTAASGATPQPEEERVPASQSEEPATEAEISAEVGTATGAEARTETGTDAATDTARQALSDLASQASHAGYDAADAQSDATAPVELVAATRTHGVEPAEAGAAVRTAVETAVADSPVVAEEPAAEIDVDTASDDVLLLDQVCADEVLPAEVSPETTSPPASPETAPDTAAVPRVAAADVADTPRVPEVAVESDFVPLDLPEKPRAHKPASRALSLFSMLDGPDDEADSTEEVALPASDTVVLREPAGRKSSKKRRERATFTPLHLEPEAADLSLTDLVEPVADVSPTRATPVVDEDVDAVLPRVTERATLTASLRDTLPTSTDDLSAFARPEPTVHAGSATATDAPGATSRATLAADERAALGLVFSANAESSAPQDMLENAGDVEVEIIEEFAKLREALDEARQGTEENDAGQVLASASALATAAENLGLHMLAGQARCLEDLALEGDMDAVRGFLPELREAVERDSRDILGQN